MGADINDSLKNTSDDDIWFKILETEMMDTLSKSEDLIKQSSTGLLSCYAELHRLDLNEGYFKRLWEKLLFSFIQTE